MCQNLDLRFLPFIAFCQVFFLAPFLFFDLAFYCLFSFFYLIFLSLFVFPFFFALVLYLFFFVMWFISSLLLLGNKRLDCCCCCETIGLKIKYIYKKTCIVLYMDVCSNGHSPILVTEFDSSHSTLCFSSQPPLLST
jgi:hypothetical protein